MTTNPLPLIRVILDGHPVELELVRNGTTDNTGFWESEALFVARDEITDLPGFQAVIDLLIRQGFNGLLMSASDNPLELTHLTVTRRAMMTEEQIARFGDQAAALVNVQYKQVRPVAVGRLVFDGEAYYVE